MNCDKKTPVWLQMFGDWQKISLFLPNGSASLASSQATL